MVIIKFQFNLLDGTPSQELKQTIYVVCFLCGIDSVSGLAMSTVVLGSKTGY